MSNVNNRNFVDHRIVNMIKSVTFFVREMFHGGNQTFSYHNQSFLEHGTAFLLRA